MNTEQISYEQMRDKGAALRTSANNLQSILEQLKVVVGRIGSEDTWKGKAATDFVNKFNNLSAKFPDFIAKVNDCAAFIDSSVNAYETSDQKLGNIANENLDS